MSACLPARQSHGLLPLLIVLSLWSQLRLMHAGTCMISELGAFSSSSFEHLDGNSSKRSGSWKVILIELQQIADCTDNDRLALAGSGAFRHGYCVLDMDMDKNLNLNMWLALAYWPLLHSVSVYPAHAG
ncbi:GH17050 [Drosophila grimshawi]|uniref:GH17050 n=1 Tax=Drosophila grimshawi TaxID=7222 RepID=B4IZJ5_DROGR|nr:GH17050 [Drosophila grimshawi]